MNELIPVAIWGGGGFLLLIILGWSLAKLYVRATKEVGFVRTGFGGEKVVINGGALVLPVFHETMPVNMNTVRLAVERKNMDALITLDRLRIDVKAEFYVRVRPGCGLDRHGRADARPADDAARNAQGPGRRQVRRRVALGRCRDDHEPAA